MMKRRKKKRRLLKLKNKEDKINSKWKVKFHFKEKKLHNINLTKFLNYLIKKSQSRNRNLMHKPKKIRELKKLYLQTKTKFFEKQKET